MKIENDSAPFMTNPHVLHMEGAAGAGVSNPGYWGIGVRPGVDFDLSIWAIARGTLSAEVRVRLVEGNRVLCETSLIVTSRWQRYDAVLRSPRGAFTTAAKLEVLLHSKGGIAIDHVSLSEPNGIQPYFTALGAERGLPPAAPHSTTLQQTPPSPHCATLRHTVPSAVWLCCYCGHASHTRGGMTHYKWRRPL